jgi:hypothetical protein
MTFSEYSQNIKERITRLQNERQQFAMIAAMDLTALIADRLTNDGVDGNNSSFPGYSEKPLPLYYFGQAKNKQVWSF